MVSGNVTEIDLKLVEETTQIIKRRALIINSNEIHTHIIMQPLRSLSQQMPVLMQNGHNIKVTFVLYIVVPKMLGQ